jgi:hypothetical protein
VAALGTDAVVTPARHAYYAGHISNLRITERGQLWRAHAGADNPDSEGGHNDLAADLTSENGGVDRGRREVSGKLCPSRLKIFHEDFGSILHPDFADDVAMLLDYVNAGLDELRFTLSHMLLFALCTPLSPQEPLQQPVRLRKLTLVSRHGSAYYTLGIEERLLTCLTHAPCLAPLLTSVALYDVISRSLPGLVDQAFRHFALRHSLERLFFRPTSTHSSGPFPVQHLKASSLRVPVAGPSSTSKS